MTSWKLNSIIELKTTEMHTAGEPVRIIESGYSEIKGTTLMEKRSFMKTNMDHIRQLLMREPRGHADMYGVILVEPDDPTAHIAALFLQNEGYSTMCGHVTMALGRYAVDKGLVKPVSPETRVNIQCPCGLVSAFVKYGKHGSGNVRFLSVPSFAFMLDVSDFRVDVPSIGEISVDIGYGGAYYAVVPASKLKVDITETPVKTLAELGGLVTKAVKKSLILTHPDNENLAFLYGTIITDGKDEFSDEPTKNVCVFAGQQVDRSPTGSGVTARIAIQYARNQILLGKKRCFSSCIDSQFFGTPVKETVCGKYPAIIVEVEGRSFYIGKSTFILELEDELNTGFLLKSALSDCVCNYHQAATVD
uniref:trans-L-3-hydroxyproline dehydratase n=1 Tax=Strigamia maritima TaxID=126957 RepID=T1JNP6_STRMM